MPEDTNEPNEIEALRQQSIALLTAVNQRADEYLKSLPKNKPPRNLGDILCGLRMALEFTQPKPAQKHEVDQRTQLTGTIEIELVPAKDGRPS